MGVKARSLGARHQQLESSGERQHGDAGLQQCSDATSSVASQQAAASGSRPAQMRGGAASATSRANPNQGLGLGVAVGIASVLLPLALVKGGKRLIRLLRPGAKASSPLQQTAAAAGSKQTRAVRSSVIAQRLQAKAQAQQQQVQALVCSEVARVQQVVLGALAVQMLQRQRQQVQAQAQQRQQQRQQYQPRPRRVQLAVQRKAQQRRQRQQRWEVAAQFAALTQQHEAATERQALEVKQQQVQLAGELKQQLTAFLQQAQSDSVQQVQQLLEAAQQGMVAAVAAQVQQVVSSMNNSALAALEGRLVAALQQQQQQQQSDIKQQAEQKEEDECGQRDVAALECHPGPNLSMNHHLPSIRTSAAPPAVDHATHPQGQTSTGSSSSSSVSIINTPMCQEAPLASKIQQQQQSKFFTSQSHKERQEARLTPPEFQPESPFSGHHASFQYSTPAAAAAAAGPIAPSRTRGSDDSSSSVSINTPVRRASSSTGRCWGSARCSSTGEGGLAGLLYGGAGNISIPIQDSNSRRVSCLGTLAEEVEGGAQGAQASQQQATTNTTRSSITTASPAIAESIITKGMSLSHSPACSNMAAMSTSSPPPATATMVKPDQPDTKTASSSPQGPTSVSATMLAAAFGLQNSSTPAAAAAAAVSNDIQDSKVSPRLSKVGTDQGPVLPSMYVMRVSDNWAQITDDKVKEFRGRQGSGGQGDDSPAIVFPGNLLQVIADQQQRRLPMLARGGQARVYPISGKILVPATPGPAKLVTGVLRVVRCETAEDALGHYNTVQAFASKADSVLPYLGMVWVPQAGANSSGKEESLGSVSSQAASNTSSSHVPASDLVGTTYYLMEQCVADLSKVISEHNSIVNGHLRQLMFSPTSGAMHVLAALLSAVKPRREGAKYVLGDIKAQNLLLSGSGAIRVTDVGGVLPVTCIAKFASQWPDQTPPATLEFCDWAMLRSSSYSAMTEAHDVHCAGDMLLLMLLGEDEWKKLAVSVEVTWGGNQEQVSVLFAEDPATWPQQLANIRAQLEDVQLRVGTSRFPAKFMDLLLGMIHPDRRERLTWYQVAKSEVWDYADCEWSSEKKMGDWRDLVNRDSAWGRLMVERLRRQQEEGA